MLKYMLKKLAVSGLLAAIVLLVVFSISLGQQAEGDEAAQYSINYMNWHSAVFQFYDLTVFQTIAAALFNTASLLVFIIVASIAVAVPGGIWIAVKSQKNIASDANTLYCLGGSLLTLLLGAVLLFGFLNASLEANNFWVNNTVPFNVLVSLFALCPVVAIIFNTHFQLSQVLRQRYIIAAQAKGLSRTQVLWRHAFSNILAPVIASVYKQIPLFLSIALILENVFRWPGIAKMSYQAILNNDIRLTAVILVVMAFVVLTAKFFADCLSAAVDPRLRIEADYYSEGEDL